MTSPANKPLTPDERQRMRLEVELLPLAGVWLRVLDTMDALEAQNAKLRADFLTLSYRLGAASGVLGQCAARREKDGDAETASVLRGLLTEIEGELAKVKGGA